MMDLIKDFFYTLIRFLTRNDSYEKKFATLKKLLTNKTPVVRFVIALAQQVQLSKRAYYKRIQHGSVKGVWFGQDVRSRSEQALANGSGPIVMFIHGGAFISGQTKMWSQWCMDIVDEHSKKYGKDLRLFFVDYTLAPDQSFPCQWNESQAAVDYLVRTLGVNPARLFLAGDSAGGNLCLQTLFEMDDAKSLAGAICFSPWARPGATLAQMGKAVDTADVAPKQGGSWYVNAENDYLSDPFGQQGVVAYVGKSMSHQTAYQSPQINPVLRSPSEFARLPNLLVPYGLGECLKDQVEEFVEKAKANGVEVEVLVSEGGVHDWPLSASNNRKVSEYHRGLEVVSAYIEKKMIHTAAAPSKKSGL